MNRDFPFVTVVMPIRNEAGFIKRSLGAVLAQDYPQGQMEVIIADGASEDNTKEIIQSFQKENSNLRLIDNPKRIVSSGLNAAIKIAKGEIVVRVDGHTVVSRDYISRCVEVLRETGADVVSGPMSGAGENYISRAIALAISTPFGTGDAKLHHLTRSQYADTIFMGAFRKEALLRVGLFNEHLVRHQDYELNYRVRKSGGRIFLSQKIHSSYYVRSSLFKLWRQYFQYGFWKARTVKAGLINLNLRYAAPLLFILSLFLWAASLVLGIRLKASALTIIPVAYLIFIIIGSITAAKPGQRRYMPILPIVFACVHLSSGFGMWAGFFSDTSKIRVDNIDI